MCNCNKGANKAPANVGFSHPQPYQAVAPPTVNNFGVPTVPRAFRAPPPPVIHGLTAPRSLQPFAGRSMPRR